MDKRAIYDRREGLLQLVSDPAQSSPTITAIDVRSLLFAHGLDIQLFRRAANQCGNQRRRTVVLIVSASAVI
jgi:hypothetical protein